MEITDKIWGTFKLSEPVLIELINSRPVQRLKNINQAGAAKYILSWKTVTRYDHSIGVMLLLRKFGALLPEQIAGLLHDTPHTAFSHVIDMVFANKDHEFHEQYLSEIVLNSEIPSILNKYKINPTTILEKHSFNLLERKIPDLCADRIDYFVRDEMSEFGLNQLILNTPNELIVKDNQFYFTRPGFAHKFAAAYMERDSRTYSDPREILSFKLLALAIKKAYDLGEITKKDLFTDDDTLEALLQKSQNSYVQSQLKLLTPSLKIKTHSKDYDFHLVNKLRYIDPQVLTKDGSLKRVSQIYPRFKKKLIQHNTMMKQGFYVKIVS